jgi:uncharacterized protein (DUF58 family)
MLERGMLERVPQRWRERLAAWGRPPRKLKVTRSGRAYLAFTIVVGVAAINTGNNLLFLVLGLLLAGVVLSGLLSELVLRAVRVARVLPDEVRAGRPAWVELAVENRGRALASMALEVRDVAEAGVVGRAFVMRLGPGERAVTGYRWTPVRRGRVRFVRLELATRYPFGLFEKWREVDVEAERVVFPRDVARGRPRLEGGELAGDRRVARAAGAGSEFFALREARADDDARHVHWPSTAKRGRPVVVEREREQRRRLVIVVDPRGEPTPAQLDVMAETAAAHATRACLEGADVSLATPDARVPWGSGPAQLRRLLHALALLERASSQAEPARGRDACVVVRPEPEPTAGAGAGT